MDELFSFGIVCDAGLKSSIEIHCIAVHTIDERLESCSSHLDFSKFQNPHTDSSILVLFIISKSFHKVGLRLLLFLRLLEF